MHSGMSVSHNCNHKMSTCIRSFRRMPSSSFEWKARLTLSTPRSSRSATTSQNNGTPLGEFFSKFSLLVLAFLTAFAILSLIGCLKDLSEASINDDPPYGMIGVTSEASLLKDEVKSQREALDRQTERLDRLNQKVDELCRLVADRECQENFGTGVCEELCD